VIATRHIDDDTRAELSAKAADLDVRVIRLLGVPAEEKDPLDGYKPQVRARRCRRPKGSSCGLNCCDQNLKPKELGSG
jgi:hypothetical protein